LKGIQDRKKEYQPGNLEVRNLPDHELISGSSDFRIERHSRQEEEYQPGNLEVRKGGLPPLLRA
jgi:hypothetical protein